MKPAGRRLLRLVDTRARELAIALDGQDQVALAGRHSGQCGFVHDVDRSFLWLLHAWPEPLNGLQKLVVRAANNRVLAGKVAVDGESRHYFVHSPSLR